MRETEEDVDIDPFNEELHGLRLYGWVQAYLKQRGWTRHENTQWFSHPDFDEFGQVVTIGFAFEVQMRDDGIDLEVEPGTWH